MNIWEKRLPVGQKFTFEVLGKEAAWSQFARIKVIPGGEYSLGDSIGEKVVVGPYTGDVKVTFKAYSRSPDGTVRESDIQAQPAGSGSETLYIEDGGGNDYNDYTVRVTQSPAKSELDRIKSIVGGAKAFEKGS